MSDKDSAEKTQTEKQSGASRRKAPEIIEKGVTRRHTFGHLGRVVGIINGLVGGRSEVMARELSIGHLTELLNDPRFEGDTPVIGAQGDSHDEIVL